MPSNVFSIDKKKLISFSAHCIYIQPEKRKRGYVLGEDGVGVIKVVSHVLIFIPWRSHIGCDWQTVLW